MGNTEIVLREVLKDTSPNGDTMRLVRERRNEVLRAAERYLGALRTYTSGSVAHRTANGDTDADGGVVLDRRSYPKLGPDGDGEGPEEVVQDMRNHLRTELKNEHPAIAFYVSKRAIRTTYHEALPDGTDPTVDLIVALTREGRALWIPNRDRDRWDVSDPECHTRLMTAPPVGLRRLRAQVVRLAKAWNKQASRPGLSSFNITALALACITEDMGIADGLKELFHHSARDLKRRLTPDPAGVSPAIKLLEDRSVVIGRLERAARKMDDALDHDDDEDLVREVLAELFGKYVEPPAGSSSKAAFASALRNGNGSVGVSGGLVLGKGIGAYMKTTRSHGGTYPGR